MGYFEIWLSFTALTGSGSLSIQPTTNRLIFTSPERGQAKINLQGPDGDPEIVSSVGIKRSDLRRLVTEVKERRHHFLEEWERIHGQLD